MRYTILVLAFLTIANFGMHSANADTTVRQCIDAARSQGQSCRELCTDEQSNDVLECRTSSKGQCGSTCGAAFSECRDPIRSQRDSGRDACSAAFEAARAQCAIDAGCTLAVNCGQSQAFFNCVTDARVTEATCKVAVNRDSALNSALRLCLRTLNRCLRRC